MASHVGKCKHDVRRCFMHFPAVEKEKIQLFTHIRWSRYCESGKEWLNFVGNETSIDTARTFQQYFSTTFDNLPADAGFHATCYRRFIDKKRIDSARKRSIRTSEQEDTTDSSFTSTKPSSSPKKKLRSRSDFHSSGPVLPVCCIICKKADKYISVANKRQKDHLAQAETESAGKGPSFPNLQTLIGRALVTHTKKGRWFL